MLKQLASVGFLAGLGFSIASGCSGDKRIFGTNAGAGGTVSNAGRAASAGTAGKSTSGGSGHAGTVDESAAGAAGTEPNDSAGAGGTSEETGGTDNGGGPAAGGKSGSSGSGGKASGGAGGNAAGGTSGSGVGGSGAGGGASSAGAGGATGAGGSSAGAAGSAAAGAAGSAAAGAGGAASVAFTLTSPDQAEGAKFDGKFTCNGGSLGSGIIPELDWSGVPPGTQSFAITFIDTTIGDTKPMGQHWAIWNIPASVTLIPQGTKTLSGALANATQTGSFLSPCSQSLMNNMDDQYEFTIYALTSPTLTVTGTSVANVLTALKALAPQPPKATLHGHAGLKGQ